MRGDVAIFTPHLSLSTLIFYIYIDKKYNTCRRGVTWRECKLLSLFFFQLTSKNTVVKYASEL